MVKKRKMAVTTGKNKVVNFLRWSRPHSFVEIWKGQFVYCAPLRTNGCNWLLDVELRVLTMNDWVSEWVNEWIYAILTRAMVGTILAPFLRIPPGTFPDRRVYRSHGYRGRRTTNGLLCWVGHTPTARSCWSVGRRQRKPRRGRSYRPRRIWNHTRDFRTTCSWQPRRYIGSRYHLPNPRCQWTSALQTH